MTKGRVATVKPDVRLIKGRRERSFLAEEGVRERKTAAATSAICTADREVGGWRWRWWPNLLSKALPYR